jgi:competence protein ComEC
MLVDAGPSDAGSKVVEYLRSRNVEKIDILVATHPHEDHIGGMEDVIDAFPIGKMWDSGYASGSQVQQAFLGLIQAKGIRFGTPRAGFVESIGDVQIDVLAPQTPLLQGTDSDANNNSIVLRISYGDMSFLLTGDMQSEERARVSEWPESTVLKIAHHGSWNGTDADFARQVSPQLAIISYGLGNPYGHPSPLIRAILERAGVPIKSTAMNGTVVVTTDGQSMQVTALGPAASLSAQGMDDYPYIGNRNSHIFHRRTCSSLPAEHNRVYFRTREEAIAAGYRPCRRCNP